jgi:hypothetical protein
MGLKNLYLEIYRSFLENYKAHKGYDFQHSPSASIPPPSVTFKDALKWWTLDRPNRLKKIGQERDRQQQEILSLKNKPTSLPEKTPPSS